MEVKEAVVSESIETLEKKVIQKNEEKQNKKRDASIELIRIVACITVVLTHLSLNVFDQYHSQVDWSRLFEKCFFSDGVPIFYMILGFFLVNGRSYKKIWKSTLKKVVIPVIIFVLFAQIFYMFILNKESITWCLENALINLNLQGIFKTIVTGDVVYINSLCSHLWYIVSYLKITLWIPVLWLLCKDTDNSKLARRMILGFGIFALLINDIQRFVTLPIGTIKSFEMIDLDILYVLLGYELFVHKDKIKNNKKVFLFSSLVFVAINVIRYKIEMNYMVLNNFYDIAGRASFVDWKCTILNIFSATAMFMAIYSFDIKNEKIGNVINWVADKTFGIYLIHYLLLAKIDLYKFDKIGNFAYELIYLAVGLVVIFALSLLIVCLLRGVKNTILKLCNILKLKKQKTN